MLAILLAVSAAVIPPSPHGAALAPCGPNKHTACNFQGKRTGSQGIPVGKRCHPDPTKAFGCREILPSQTTTEPRAAAR